MMITRIKTTLILTLFALTMVAQEKLFTLEDLNFGGTNFHNMQPKNMWLTWWGDQLIQTDVEECYTIDVKTGKKKLLFTLDDINKWADSDDSVRYVRHLMNATFPYPNLPIVSVGNRHAVIHVDFKKHEVVWQDSISGQEANDWSPQSKATAYVEDCQLYVADGQGHKHQLTTDGSREIVYGQSVHRDEFGISKGTFWSPDGQRLAFYRMDQSMVTDYPQVDIQPDTELSPAKMEPDKYPMAGGKTHVVTIGVFDLQTQKTIYLQTPATNVEPTALDLLLHQHSMESRLEAHLPTGAEPRPERLPPRELRRYDRQTRVSTLPRDQRQVRGAAASHTVPAVEQQPLHHAEPEGRLQPPIPI